MQTETPTKHSLVLHLDEIGYERLKKTIEFLKEVHKITDISIAGKMLTKQPFPIPPFEVTITCLKAESFYSLGHELCWRALAKSNPNYHLQVVGGKPLIFTQENRPK